ATVYQTLGELRRHGLGAGRFAVPEPLAWEPAHRLLLLTWAEGESLSAVVLARPDASPEIEGAAEWLLALHQCGVDTGRRYSFLGHLRTLAGWRELLAAVYPAGERLLEDLLGRFEERGRELSGWAPGPTHRDFSPEHLVVRGNQFTGLDFDEFCQYDPLFDVAHFVAQLGFLVSTWPRLSATFILNEVIAVERSGVSVRIFSVKDPDGEPVHPAVAQVAARVSYLSLPRHRKAAVHANLRVLCRHPGRYCQTLL